MDRSNRNASVEWRD